MFHAACVPVAHTTPLKIGHVSVIMRRFELEPFLSTIEKFKITDVAIVPPIAIAIMMSGLTDKYALDSVRAVAIGAAPLGKDSQTRLRSLLPKEAKCNQVWGMTEMTCIGSMFHFPEDDDTGSVGHMLPNCDSKYAVSDLLAQSPH